MSLDEGVHYLNPKHFSVAQLVAIMEKTYSPVDKVILSTGLSFYIKKINSFWKIEKPYRKIPFSAVQ